MARTFSNNAESVLDAGISAGATSLTVATGDGAEFPATGDFTVRIEDASVSTSFELVTCTARSGDTLTISATAGAWDAGDKVFHVVAKADLDAFLQTGTEASAIVVNPTINGADDVQEALADKVHLTGDQTVAGIKTFSSIPVGPASDPTTDNQLARKAYVDTEVAAAGGGATVVRKTADETLSSNSTLQNDDHLALTVGANEFWAFELYVVAVAGNSNPDINMDFTSPSGATVWWSKHPDWTTSDGNNATVGAWPGTQSLSIGLGTSERAILIKGSISTGATAGTLQFRWAQNTATSTTTVKAGSYLVANKA